MLRLQMASIPHHHITDLTFIWTTSLALSFLTFFLLTNHLHSFQTTSNPLHSFKMYRAISLATALIASVRAQQACTSTQETHPPLTWSKCTESGCTEVSGSVVVDANWRWTHTVEGSTNCYTGNEWDTSICPDGKTCAEKCCVDGADYAATYGVTTSGDQLSLSFVTKVSC